MTWKEIIISWDIFIALVLSVLSYFFFPDFVSMKFTIEVYGVGISVLSIIFSLFFAALAILMSSSDNDFIVFLEEENDYSDLLSSFKFTVMLLFLSLVYGLILYIGTYYYIIQKAKSYDQHISLLVIFIFLFSYSLLASIFSVNDSLKFSEFRARFLKSKKTKTTKDSKKED